MVLADPAGSILVDYVKTGKFAAAGSWLVGGIEEDFIPSIADLTGVREAYSVSDADSCRDGRGSRPRNLGPDLEGAPHGFAFSSGMAATSTVLELLDSGAHVVALDDLYGGTRRVFERVRRRSAGLSFTYSTIPRRAARRSSRRSRRRPA